MVTRHLSTGSTAPPIIPGKLRLYSMRFCPYAQRIHLVLDAKRIPYDVVYVNLQNKPNWLYDKNPMGKVPSIEFENGDTLHESLIIAEYLDEAYSENRLMADEPKRKAQDKLLISQFNNIATAIYEFLAESCSNPYDIFRKILTDLDVFEKELTKRNTSYFGGQRPGMVDFMIWPWCERADVLSILRGSKFVIPNERFIRLLEWKTAMKEEAAVQSSYLTPEIHMKYLHSKYLGVTNYDILNEL